MSDEPIQGALSTLEPAPAPTPPEAVAQKAPPKPTRKKPTDASPADVVLRYTGTAPQTVRTSRGAIPPRDITRGEAADYFTWAEEIKAVTDSGLFKAVEGTRIVLPAAPASNA